MFINIFLSFAHHRSEKYRDLFFSSFFIWSGITFSVCFCTWIFEYDDYFSRWTPTILSYHGRERETIKRNISINAEVRWTIGTSAGTEKRNCRQERDVKTSCISIGSSRFTIQSSRSVRAFVVVVASRSSNLCLWLWLEQIEMHQMASLFTSSSADVMFFF